MMKQFFLLCIVCSLHFNMAFGAISIDLNKGVVDPLPVAIDFTSNSAETKEFSKSLYDIVKNNLNSSGIFQVIDNTAFLESNDFNIKPNFSNWRKINAAVLLVGNVEMINSKNIKVQFRIWDPYKEISLVNLGFQVSPSSLRRVAHKISDQIYTQVTGETGYFDTKISFIAETGSKYRPVRRLAIMDQDGYGVKYLSNGQDLVLTPRFDNKGERILYMRYIGLKAKVFLYNLTNSNNEAVGNFTGMSFAARFSPDGKNAIMSVSEGQNTGIYEVNLQSKQTKKILSEYGVINTSPSYSPDGKEIVFNSDRAQSRQIYIMNKDGSNIRRISFEAGVYATPVWSPRGDFIAFTKILNGSFYIGVMRPDGSGERLLTTSWLEESPSWAPNGRSIIFYREGLNKSRAIYKVDLTGYNEKEIPTTTNVSDPDWSPLL